MAGTKTLTSEIAGFEIFYEQQVDHVYRFLRLRCSAELAEDLTAEVFVAAYKAWQSGDLLEPGWLMTVARRRLIDEWRREARWAESVHTLVVPCRDISNESAQTDGRLTILEVLDHLPGAQRQALLLRYVEEQTVSAIAETLDRSYRAVESLLARGRSNFARLYRQSGEATNGETTTPLTSTCDALSKVA